MSDLKQHLSTLTNGLILNENVQQRNYVITNLRRHKTSTPFSQSLNDFILQWYNNHSHHFIFTETDDFDENDIDGTFEKHKQRFKETDMIHIWTGCSDNTIFGEPTINHYFRAWHDYIHITENYGYDFVGESIVANIQCSQLPHHLIFERELILCEIVGQAQYFMKHNEFVKNQRNFTRNYLSDCRTALLHKQH